MSDHRILVAGLGNLFRGDDAFGSEVARRLPLEQLPPGVIVKDFGTRGYDFAYALGDGYEWVVIVDAVSRGADPGTLFVMEPQADDLETLCYDEFSEQSHDMNPMAAIKLTQAMGRPMPRLILVGCEPLELGDDQDGLLGLSDPVAKAIDPAIQRVVSVLMQLECERERVNG